jgi:hypothetical protein
VVEFGTWSGAGSSKIIGEALKHKPQAFAIGFEVNQRMAHQSASRLRKYSNFEVVYGSAVGIEALDSTGLTQIEKEWLRKDIADMETAPFAESKIPNSFDLCLLDGGEFSSYAEWKLVSTRVSKWILLDDTLTRKNSKVLEDSISSGVWNLVDFSQERNGIAILRRIKSKP